MEFDEEKDYYRILGLPPTATFEELKAAHIQLALKFHPDVGYSSSDTVSEEVSASRIEKFRNISEAWSVLSKTDRRTKYDTARIKAGHMLSSQSVSHLENLPIEIPTSFNTQRDNFGVALKKAGDTWKGNRDKYKCERWNKLSHKDKLLSRRVAHGSLLGNTLAWTIPVLVVGYATYTFIDLSSGGRDSIGGRRFSG